MKTDSLFYHLLRAQPTLAFDLASQPADGIDWPDFLETILVYKLPKFTREEIQKMLNFNDIGLKQTRFYQDVFGEGREEGRVEGEAALLLRQLERTIAHCLSPPASVSPPPMPRPCCSGASASSMPTAWTRCGGIEHFPQPASFRADSRP